MNHRKGGGCLGNVTLPAACNACEGIGTSFNVKPLRISEGVETRERRPEAVKAVKTATHFQGSSMVHPWFLGHPMSTAFLCRHQRLGCVRARKHCTHIKITLLIISHFQYGKENAFGLCPQLCRSHVSMLLRQELGSGLHGEPTLDRRGGAEPSDT